VLHCYQSSCHARTTGAHSASPWSWASATPVIAAEKSGSDEHQAEPAPIRSKGRTASRRIDPSQARLALTLGSTSRQSPIIASDGEFRCDSRSFQAPSSPRGWLLPAGGSVAAAPALGKVASLRASSDEAGVNVRGGLARAFGKAPSALSARNCVHGPINSNEGCPLATASRAMRTTR
jgi:hypothetical protein